MKNFKLKVGDVIKIHLSRNYDKEVLHTICSIKNTEDDYSYIYIEKGEYPIFWVHNDSQLDFFEILEPTENYRRFTFLESDIEVIR